MPSIFFKVARKGRRRHRDGTLDGTTMALTDAGIRLLARKDYDAISMAQIAREAGCSVGALYSRYSEKNSYLYRIIAHAFRSMRDDAQRTLDRGRWQVEPANFITKQIVSHVVTQMTTPRAAGIIRATIKLATVKSVAMGLFEDYRADVTELAVGLLTKRARISPGTIRIGVQVVLGTITDAILQKHPGPMNAGSARMTATLTNVLIGYLGLTDTDSWAGEESDGEDDPADAPDAGSETPPNLAEGEIAIFDPINRTFLGKTSTPVKKRRKSGLEIKPTKSVPQPPPTRPSRQSETAHPSSRAPVKSATVKALSPEMPLNSNRKPKHRFI